MLYIGILFFITSHHVYEDSHITDFEKSLGPALTKTLRNLFSFFVSVFLLCLMFYLFMEIILYKRIRSIFLLHTLLSVIFGIIAAIFVGMFFWLSGLDKREGETFYLSAVSILIGMSVVSKKYYLDGLLTQSKT